MAAKRQTTTLPLKMLKSYFRFFALKPHVMVDKVLYAINLNPYNENCRVSFKKFLLAKCLVVEKYRRYLSNCNPLQELNFGIAAAKELAHA